MSDAHAPLLELVVAADSNMGIGREGDLPWRLKGDMAFFREVTTDASSPVVIMGRRTWESIPTRFRPLKNRHNIVLTRNQGYTLPPNVDGMASFEDAVIHASRVGDRTFVIGGGHIYWAALAARNPCVVHLTEVAGEYECDTFLPKLSGFERVWTDNWQHEGNHQYRFTRWVRAGSSAITGT